MLKIFDNSRFLLGLCIVSVLAACVPIGIGVFEQYRLHREISEIESVYAVATQAREVLDVVSQSMPSFTAGALNLTKEERKSIFSKTDKYLNRLGLGVKKLINSASSHVPPEKITAVVASIDNIGHSWKEIRRYDGLSMAESEKKYHFLKMFYELQVSRALLSEIDISANRVTRETIDGAFAEVQKINLMLIAALCAGAFVGFIAVYSNFRSARSTRTLNQRLDAAITHMGPGLCMFDGEKRLVVCNDRYASLYGLEIDHLRPGLTLREILEQRVANAQFSGTSTKAYIQEHIRSVDERFPSTKIQQMNDGRIIEIVHRPLPGSGWLATHDDITDRKHAEDELVRHRDHLQELVNEATEELKQKADDLNAALNKEKELNQIQRQFVSMASHEFRTPLSVIDTIAQGLKRRINRLTPEEAVERIDQIRDAVKRMVRLMESTLMTARLEEGKASVEFGSCDLGAVVRIVCERQQELTHTHRISCRLVDLPDFIQADSDALDQVFTNLLSNAVKYAPDAPEIEVVAYGEGDQVRIYVRDRGLGIDEEDLPCMFERFFRAKTSTGIAGTGIGLNLALNLVDMHGGTIAVDSREGEGSTFTVCLPIDGPEQDTKLQGQAA